MTPTTIDLSTLTPSVIYTIVAEVITEAQENNYDPVATDVITAAYNVEYTNNGPLAFFRGVAQELERIEAHSNLSKAITDREYIEQLKKASGMVEPLVTHH